MNNPVRIVTGVCRGLYMQQTLKLEYPRDENGNITTEDYKVSGCRVLIPKRDKTTLKKIRDAIKYASEKKFGKMAVREGKTGYPLLDGDEALEDDIDGKKGKEFKNHYYLNCKSFDRLPGLVDADNCPVEDVDEKAELLVSGYYFKFSLTFKGSDTGGTKRVRCELNNIMFVKEGERLDGGVAADAENWGDESYDDDDDDDDDYEEEKSSRRSRRSRSSRRDREEREERPRRRSRR